MTERTDHAAEAVRLINSIDALGIHATSANAQALIGAAQVQATLAVAEQQRIANVISVGEQFETPSSPDGWLRERVLRADVREGLGL